MNDTYECSNCHTLIDENDANWCECEHCDNIYCPECAKTMFKTCEHCGSYVTDDCLIECDECHNFHCKKCAEHTYTCPESDDIFCCELCHEGCRTCMSEYELRRIELDEIADSYDD